MTENTYPLKTSREKDDRVRTLIAQNETLRRRIDRLETEVDRSAVDLANLAQQEKNHKSSDIVEDGHANKIETYRRRPEANDEDLLRVLEETKRAREIFEAEMKDISKERVALRKERQRLHEWSATYASQVGAPLPRPIDETFVPTAIDYSGIRTSAMALEVSVQRVRDDLKRKHDQEIALHLRRQRREVRRLIDGVTRFETLYRERSSENEDATDVLSEAYSKLLPDAIKETFVAKDGPHHALLNDDVEETFDVSSSLAPTNEKERAIHRYYRETLSAFRTRTNASADPSSSGVDERPVDVSTYRDRIAQLEKLLAFSESSRERDVHVHEAELHKRDALIQALRGKLRRLHGILKRTKGAIEIDE